MSKSTVLSQERLDTQIFIRLCVSIQSIATIVTPSWKFNSIIKHIAEPLSLWTCSEIDYGNRQLRKAVIAVQSVKSVQSLVLFIHVCEGRAMRSRSVKPLCNVVKKKRKKEKKAKKKSSVVLIKATTAVVML